MKNALLIALGIFTVGYLIVWVSAIARGDGHRRHFPGLLDAAIGFFTNFLDTLGIGSFATTSALFKLCSLVPDEQIPGTMNVGHTLPTVTEAFLFMGLVAVDPTTLVSLLAASAVGAWLGAGVVSHWPRRKVQIGMGSVLVLAACLMLMSLFNWGPGGGNAMGLTGTKLVIGILGNALLGALMTLGIGLYAPCMILIYLLGMNPLVAFPIMMGSCAFLMPVGSARFIRTGSYNLKSAAGLAIGGIPGVLVAFYLVKSLPLNAVKWLVVVVVLYTSAKLLETAYNERLGVGGVDARGGLSEVDLGFAGLAVGALVGFLLRPAAMGAQLPFLTVMSRGGDLAGISQALVPFARTSFNVVLAGGIAGAVVGVAAARVAGARRSV